MRPPAPRAEPHRGFTALLCLCGRPRQDDSAELSVGSSPAVSPAAPQGRASRAPLGALAGAPDSEGVFSGFSRFFGASTTGHVGDETAQHLHLDPGLTFSPNALGPSPPPTSIASLRFSATALELSSRSALASSPPPPGAATPLAAPAPVPLQHGASAAIQPTTYIDLPSPFTTSCSGPVMSPPTPLLLGPVLPEVECSMPPSVHSAIAAAPFAEGEPQPAPRSGSDAARPGEDAHVRPPSFPRHVQDEPSPTAAPSASSAFSLGGTARPLPQLSPLPLQRDMPPPPPPFQPFAAAPQPLAQPLAQLPFQPFAAAPQPLAQLPHHSSALARAHGSHGHLAGSRAASPPLRRPGKATGTGMAASGSSPNMLPCTDSSVGPNVPLNLSGLLGYAAYALGDGCGDVGEGRSMRSLALMSSRNSGALSVGPSSSAAGASGPGFSGGAMGLPAFASAQLAPSPHRSSAGFALGSRVSLSGAASVLSLPLETASLCEVTAPQTGLVAEQTVLEVNALAPPLDLWAAGAAVSPQCRIAQGAHGLVYRGLWHGCTCAVKFMLAASAENLAAQLTEVFLCKALTHPNIVQTFDCSVWRVAPETLLAIDYLCEGPGAAAAAAGSYPLLAAAPGGPTSGSGLSAPSGSAVGGAPTDSGLFPPVHLSSHWSVPGSAHGSCSPGALGGAAGALALAHLQQASMSAGTAGMAPASPSMLYDMPGPLLAGNASAGGPSGYETSAHCHTGVHTSASTFMSSALNASVSGQIGGAQRRASTGAATVESWGTIGGRVLYYAPPADGPYTPSPSCPVTPGGSVAAVPVGAGAWPFIPAPVLPVPQPHAPVVPSQSQQSRAAASSTYALRNTPTPPLPPPLPHLLRADSVDGLPLQDPLPQPPLPPSAAAPQRLLSGQAPPARPLQPQPPRQLARQRSAREALAPPTSPSGVGMPPPPPLASRLLGPVSEERLSGNVAGDVAAWGVEPAELRTLGPDVAVLAAAAAGGSAGGGGAADADAGARRASTSSGSPSSVVSRRRQLASPTPRVVTVAPGRTYFPAQQQQQAPSSRVAYEVYVTLPPPLPPPPPPPPVPAPAPPVAPASGPRSLGTLLSPTSSLPPPAQVERVMRKSSIDLYDRSRSGRIPGYEHSSSRSGSSTPRSAAAGGGAGGAGGPGAAAAAGTSASAVITAAVAAAALAPTPRGPAPGSPDAPQPQQPPLAGGPASGSLVPSASASAGASVAATRMASVSGYPYAGPAEAMQRGPSASPPFLSRATSRNRSASQGVASASGHGLSAIGQALAPVASGGPGAAAAGVGGSASFAGSPDSVTAAVGGTPARGRASRRGSHSTQPPPTGSGSAAVHCSSPIAPLIARNAIATGDEADAAAAAAGARNLAQVLRQLGAREGQLAVMLVLEECERGSLQQLLSKAAAAAAAAAPPATPLGIYPTDASVEGSGGGGRGGARRMGLYGPFTGGGRYDTATALRALVATAREIALGMAYLHLSHIVHGDLKPGNCLLKSSRQDQRGFVVKISDFGLSRVLHPGASASALYAVKSMDTGGSNGAGGGSSASSARVSDDGDGAPRALPLGAAAQHGSRAHQDSSRGGRRSSSGTAALDGTVPYLSPELIDQGNRSKASDVWAYGVLLWQLVTGARPYEGLLHVQIMVAVCSGEQLLVWPPGVHPALEQLGRACLAFNPRERPSFAQIVRRLQQFESELRADVGSRHA